MSEKQYKLLREFNHNELSEKVEQLLNDNWELYGSPSCSLAMRENGELETLFSQAMTKNVKTARRI